MSAKTPPSPRFSPDDALPPVEPPSAGFIIQLFVIPGVIVLVVVAIWLMFSWLAQKDNDSEAYVRALARNNDARWQAALNLATDLRAERSAKEPRLTVDPKLAGGLADILDREISEGSLEQNPLELRIYLSRALGEFRIDGPLPVLVRAASTQRDEREADVRRAALEGIAILASNATDTQPMLDDEKLREALLAAAGDDDPRTRSVAAVAMGVLGGEVFKARLRNMLDDADANVRYNAATRLAHWGDPASIDVLKEMLDLDENAGVEQERKELKDFKRALVVQNALRASEQLAAANPQADLRPLEAAIEAILARNSIHQEMRVGATETLRTLRAGAASP